MPRPPKFIHPVRKIRTILGFSQSRFARMVGCSTPTIQAIENGKRPLTGRLATNIYLYTGANHHELMKGKSGIVIGAINGRPFDQSYFKWWQTVHSAASPDQLNKWLEHLPDSLQIIFQAACRPGINKMPMIHRSFINWCNDTVKDFNLDKPIKAILGDRKYVESLTMTYGDWRKAGDLAALYKFTDKKSARANEKLKLSIKWTPGWTPGTDMKPKPADKELRLG